MKRLSIFITSLMILLGSAGLLVSTASAAPYNPFNDLCSGQGQTSAVCKANGKDPITGADQEGILIKVTNLVSIGVGVAAVIVIIIGGIEYILSSGDSSRINSAKNTILFAVVGLVIAALAQVIIQFVLGKL